jgi:hypothetical protein
MLRIRKLTQWAYWVTYWEIEAGRRISRPSYQQQLMQFHISKRIAEYYLVN